MSENALVSHDKTANRRTDSGAETKPFGTHSQDSRRGCVHFDFKWSEVATAAHWRTGSKLRDFFFFFSFLLNENNHNKQTIADHKSYNIFELQKACWLVAEIDVTSQR